MLKQTASKKFEEWLLKVLGSYVNIGLAAMLFAVTGLSTVFYFLGSADSRRAVYLVLSGAVALLILVARQSKRSRL